MADLILTEEEQAAATWFELDDATVGKIVKKTALGLLDHSDEQKRVWWFAAALLLVGMADDANADTFSQEINDFTNGDDNRGNWRVTIERIPASTESNQNVVDNL